MKLILSFQNINPRSEAFPRTVEQLITAQSNDGPLIDGVLFPADIRYHAWADDVVKKSGRELWIWTNYYDIGSAVEGLAYRRTIEQCVTGFTVCPKKSVMKAAIEGRKTALLDLHQKIKNKSPDPTSITLKKLIKKGQLIKPLILVATYPSDDRENRDFIRRKVRNRVEEAVAAGIDGIVVAGGELRYVIEKVLPTLDKKARRLKLIAVALRTVYLPVKRDDQKRTISPKEAQDLGADYGIIGRPVLQSENSIKAVELIRAELLGQPLSFQRTLSGLEI